MRVGKTNLVLVCALLALLSFGAASCRRAKTSTATNDAADSGAAASNSSSSVQNNSQTPTSDDMAKYDADIARLEAESLRSPGDDDTRNDLSNAYVRRADANRRANRLREALRDYQKALRINPDNEAAQNEAAALADAATATKQGENFEPAPPPISPDIVTDEDAGEASKTNKSNAPQNKERRGKKPL